MSKAKLIGLGVAVAALAATPALAQTSGPSTTRPSTSAPSGAPSTRAAMPSDIKAMKASDLIGKNVYSANDERIGEVDDVVVSKSGNAPAAVIGVGGFLGIGEKKAAVPLDQLQVQGDKIVAAGLSKESLKAQADYKDADYTKYDRNRTLGEAASGATRTSPATGSGSTGMGSGSSTSPSGSSGMGGGTGSSPTSPSGSSTAPGSAPATGSGAPGSSPPSGSTTTN